MPDILEQAKEYYLNKKYEEIIELIGVRYTDDSNLARMLGKAYKGLRNYNQALTFLELADRMAPSDHRNLFHLGTTYILLKKYGLAIKPLSEAAQLDPHCYKTHINLGHTYMQIKKYGAATKSFDVATGLVTDGEYQVSYALYNQYYCLMMQGKYKQGSDILIKAINAYEKHEKLALASKDCVFFRGFGDLLWGAVGSGMKD